MSSAFPDWAKHAVRQRRPQSGCIPTGYEMLLRAAGAEGIDFASFQDDFDLDQNLGAGELPANSFEAVAAVVRAKYPRVSFQRRCFAVGNGGEKLKFVEERLAQGQLVLVSLALRPFGADGWHIMPVVDATDEELVFLKEIGSDGKPDVLRLQKVEFVRIHDRCDGGDDVAYLEEWR